MVSYWSTWKGMDRETKPRLSPPRRSQPLKLERLEDRLTPSWASLPPAAIVPPTAFQPVTLDTQSNATGNAAVTNNETDWYRFTSTAAGSYVLEATTPTSNLDTVIGLYSANGLRLGSND